jgi:hypothetical protein
LAQASDFQDAKKQIELGSSVTKAVILGNVIAGLEQIVDHGAKNVQKGFNAFG